MRPTVQNRPDLSLDRDRRLDTARPAMFDRQRHALALGLVLLAVGAIMAVVIGRDPVDSVLQPIDDRWLDAMVEVRTDWLTDIAGVLSVLGGPYVMVPLRLLVTAGLALQRRWLQLGAWVGAIVTSELCIGPLKALIDRPRPPIPAASRRARRPFRPAMRSRRR